MAVDNSRAAILQRLRAKVAKGQPIVGGGAGTGISAKCEEAGGADLIVIYNSGRFRMAGRGSLAGLMPYGNANQSLVERARGGVAAVRHTPARAARVARGAHALRERQSDRRGDGAGGADGSKTYAGPGGGVCDGPVHAAGPLPAGVEGIGLRRDSEFSDGGPDRRAISCEPRRNG